VPKFYQQNKKKKKKQTSKLPIFSKRTGPLYYRQQHDNLTLRMKAFKVTKDQLVNTVVNIRKMTVNSRNILFGKQSGRHAE